MNMSIRNRSENLARIVALVAPLGGAFQIYVYLNPDSSKLPALTIYLWYVASIMLVLTGGVIVGKSLKGNRRKRTT